LSLRRLGRLLAGLLGGIVTLAVVLAVLAWWRAGATPGGPGAVTAAVPTAAPAAVPSDMPAQAPPPPPQVSRGDPQALAMLPAADVSRGAVLQRESPPLVFDLPPTASVVRLLLNPGLADIDDARRRRQEQPKLRWRYVIAVRALDAQGETLLAREHHLRRDLAELRLADGTWSTGAFYLERGAPVPLRSNEVRVDFTGLPRPARLELRLLAADPDIADVLVRVSAPFPATLRNPATEWQRLNDSQRARLAAGNAFPPAALAPAERTNLIASRWLVVAPGPGAPSRDLHVLREASPAPPATTLEQGDAGRSMRDPDPSLLARSLESAWAGAGTVRRANAADDPGWTRTEVVFERLLHGDRSAELRREARSLGWALRQGQVGEVGWTVLQESAARRTGRGLYAFSDSGRHAIQAPHVPTDLHTGEIALAMAHDGAPRAVAWNTVPRREADLVHLRNSALHAFSRAFAGTFPKERIVQLHGYHAGQDRADVPADAIVSAARERPGSAARSVAECMREQVASETGLYGVDTESLGGERNRIARELLRSGYRRFIHLEMSLPLREALLEDASLRRALLDCLEGSR
jgi:hypothetical protein